MLLRRHFVKTSRAKTRVVGRTHGRAKTLPEDSLGEDAWVCEDTSRRQVGRKHVSSRRDTGVRRHFPKGKNTCRREDTRAKTFPEKGRAKTCVVAKTHGRAKTLPQDRRVVAKTHVRRAEGSHFGFLGGLEAHAAPPDVAPGCGFVKSPGTWRCRTWQELTWRRENVQVASPHVAHVASVDLAPPPTSDAPAGPRNDAVEGVCQHRTRGVRTRRQ